MEKYLSLLFFTSLIIHLQAIIPVINAKIKPIINGRKDSLFIIVSAQVMSLITLPIIKGTTIRKENLAAFSLSIPRITALEIVAPDLEIPGTIAIACAIPTRSEDEKLIFFSLGLALRILWH